MEGMRGELKWMSCNGCQRNLGARAHYRSIAEDDGASVLRETDEPYGPISASKRAA
jgi:hypothetical protein